MERGSGRKQSYLVRDVCESERNEIHQWGHSGSPQLLGIDRSKQCFCFVCRNRTKVNILSLLHCKYFMS